MNCSAQIEIRILLIPDALISFSSASGAMIVTGHIHPGCPPERTVSVIGIFRQPSWREGYERGVYTVLSPGRLFLPFPKVNAFDEQPDSQ
jgi:hypothetical protein